MSVKSEEEFLLKWHDHHSSFFLLVEELVTREQLTDVTLSCGDTILNAHSLMLSVCSPYFRGLLSESQHREKHHIIHLNGVSGKLMQQLLVYMYRGEISIAQEDLGPLIETARCLQIKGLSLATSDLTTTSTTTTTATSTANPKKRSASECPEYTITLPPRPNKERKIVKKSSPVKFPVCPSSPVEEIKALAIQDEYPGKVEEEDYVEYPDYSNTSTDEITVTHPATPTDIADSSPLKFSSPDQSKGPPPPPPDSNMAVALPLLPKPLAILKTAETRTFLSKLIWLGNGGRRPQYGNPETKPVWWPQHVLPWGEMKKMGGRKSQELSHINYTEILKQCLAAGYEYFGYDPATYYSTEAPQLVCDTSFTSLDGGGGEEDSHGEVERMEDGEPELEIDLDSVQTLQDSPDKSLHQKIDEHVRNQLEAVQQKLEQRDKKQILCK